MRDSADFGAIYQTSIQLYDVQFSVRPAQGFYLGNADYDYGLICIQLVWEADSLLSPFLQ